MAEEEDQSQKTEDPTARRIEKAKEKGQTAVSQEVKNWLVLLGGTIALLSMFPAMMKDVLNIGLPFIQRPHLIPVDLQALQRLLADLAAGAALTLAPLFILLVVLALFASLAQTGLIWSPEKVSPQASRLSLIKGLKNKFSSRSLVEFAKGMLKIIVVGVVSYLAAAPLLRDVAVMPGFSLGETLDRVWWVCIWISSVTVAIMTVIAVLDFAYQKFTFFQQMKMTKQEVKDEHKDTEGDPYVKARLRQLRIQRARQRMIAAVPEADVVVTNPTHYAVALKYDMAVMPAPKVVAKGVDAVAQRIRDVANENDVPLVENPPLARALFAAVELDEEIPPEHYKAVAEVIGYVMRLKSKMPGK